MTNYYRSLQVIKKFIKNVCSKFRLSLLCFLIYFIFYKTIQLKNKKFTASIKW